MRRLQTIATVFGGVLALLILLCSCARSDQETMPDYSQNEIDSSEERPGEEMHASNVSETSAETNAGVDIGCGEQAGTNKEDVPTTPCGIQSNVYSEYYRIIEELIKQYGVHLSMWHYGEYIDGVWCDSNPTGVTNVYLVDMDTDGTEELICLYWPASGEMRILIYTYEDVQSKLLLDKEVPDSYDNVKGFDGFCLKKDGTNGCMLSGQDIEGYRSGTPHATSVIYEKSGNTLTFHEFTMRYSEPFGTGDPMPEWITVSYWIDGEEVDYEAYKQEEDAFWSEVVSWGWEYDIELQDSVESIGQKAGKSAEEIAELTKLIKHAVNAD